LSVVGWALWAVKPTAIASRPLAHLMTTPLSEIISELDRLMSPQAFEDYGVNGLQVPGRERVGTVVSAVSAHAELFQRASDRRADMVLVHHGILWGGGLVAVSRELKLRLSLLFAADMSLTAYHLPLDGHPTLGNNAQLVGALGATDAGAFGHHRGAAIGRRGRFAGDGLTPDELVRRVARVTGRDPLCFAHGPERVHDVAIVSGAGASFFEEAIQKGVDAFITGEPAERVMAQAREGAVHFLAAGHYATETMGVQRLGEHLSGLFGVEHHFIDVPNPI